MTTNIWRQFLPKVPTAASIRLVEEMQTWESLLGPDTPYKKLDYYMGSRNSDNPMVWFVWKQLPDVTRFHMTNFLSKLSGSDTKIRKEVLLMLSSIDKDPLRPQTFFTFMFETWLSDRRGSDISFEEWIKIHQNNYQEMATQNRNLESELREKQNWALTAMEAQRMWSDVSGVHSLNISHDDAGANIVVANNSYPVRIRSTSRLAIKVPRGMVRVAAWNPIYTSVLKEKMSQWSLPVSRYPGFMGADGFFYLLDANHRFTVDRRPEVWIEMSYPAKTSSMHVTFDAMGLKQPSVEQLIQLQRGEITLEDIIPRNAHEIIFR